MSGRRPVPIGVLVSGSGSNLQALIDRVEDGSVNGRIVIVISNVADAYGLRRAENHRLPTAVIPHAEYPRREAYDAALAAALKAAGVELVCLAGFMRVVTPVLLDAFPNRVMNIHPALLPAFPGSHGQRQALEYGARLAGCTVHFVDERVDHGPIIIQAAVPVLPDDDEERLSARILRCEHRIYPEAVRLYCAGRLGIDGRRVVVSGVGSGDETAARLLINPPLSC